MDVPTQGSIPRVMQLRGILLSWILGLCLARVPGFSVWWGIVTLAAAALCLFPLRGTIPWKATALFAVAFLLSVTRSALALPPLIPDTATIAAHTGETLALTGTVTEVSSVDGTSSRFILETTLPYAGKVYVRSGHPLEVRYGEIVTASGKVEEPLDFTPEFSWKAYLQGRGIAAVMTDPRVEATGRHGKGVILRSFDALRQRVSDDMATLLPHRSAALLSGILMGSKASFSRGFLDDLQATGLTHIVALSGFNITILIAFVTGLLLRGTGRYARFFLSVVVVGAFILLVGPSASVIRAAVMGVITLLALTVGRRADPLNMLLLALAVMTAYEPAWLFVDLGFQLSFLATLGIILFLPFSQALVTGKKGLAIIAEGLFTTMAAQVTTLPFLLLNFGTVSLIAPVANLVVVCTIPAIMLLGSLAVLVGFIPGLGFVSQALGFLAYLPLAYVEGAIGFFSRLPFASLRVTWWDGYWTAAAYALIAMGYYFMAKRRIGRGSAA